MTALAKSLFFFIEGPFLNRELNIEDILEPKIRDFLADLDFQGRSKRDPDILHSCI